MIDYQAFGQRVRQVRREQRMTQAVLAEKLGISNSFMGHIERGTRIASLETLVTLCNVLKISPQALLQDSLTDAFDNLVPQALPQEQRLQLSNLLRTAHGLLSEKNLEP